MAKNNSNKFNYEITNRASGVAEIKIYGYIGKWEEFDYKKFQNMFRDLLSQNSDITVRLHCGGGSVYEGLAIYDLMRSSEATIKVVVEGMAASMGSILALGGDEIQMTENAFFMMHAPMGGAYGNKRAMAGVITQLESCEERLKKIYGDRTKATDEEIENWFNSDKDTWLDSDQCLKLSICDEIIKPVKKRKFENPENKSPEALWASFEGEPPTNPVNTQTPNIETMNKARIIALLGAASIAHSLSASSDDAAFESVLENVIKDAGEAEGLKAQLKKVKEDNADVLVNQAIQDGKITAGEKAEWRDDAIENYALTAKAIERMSGKPEINNSLDRSPKNPETTDNEHEILNGREKWDLDKWQAEDPKGLESLEDKAPQAFKELFNKKFNK